MNAAHDGTASVAPDDPTFPKTLRVQNIDQCIIIISIIYHADFSISGSSHFFR